MPQIKFSIKTVVLIVKIFSVITANLGDTISIQYTFIENHLHLPRRNRRPVPENYLETFLLQILIENRRPSVLWILRSNVYLSLNVLEIRLDY